MYKAHKKRWIFSHWLIVWFRVVSSSFLNSSTEIIEQYDHQEELSYKSNENELQHLCEERTYY